MENKRKSTGIVLSALFAALISASCFIQIPLPGGIPITLQDMMAMLSGLLLGPIYGTISVLVFLILGCIGLPVFSGKAGLHVLTAGPTGGFLIGYLLSALIGGIILSIILPRRKQHSNFYSYIIITAVAFVVTIVVFICGIIGFIRVTGAEFSKTISAVLIPFIPGNLIKIALMIPLTKKFRPIISNYIG